MQGVFASAASAGGATAGFIGTSLHVWRAAFGSFLSIAFISDANYKRWEVED